jgi:aminobenzoyl-glutamate transport protein
MRGEEQPPTPGERAGLGDATGGGGRGIGEADDALASSGSVAGRAMARFLSVVEWLGNLLPHPVTLFALFAVAVVVASGVASWAGLSVENPRPGRDGEMFTVTNLMSGEGVRWMSQNLVTNFTQFVPLGTVLVALLGVGVAERSGLLTAMVRSLVLGAPKNLVTLVIVFAGVLSNTASEMGYVVLIPLAMAIFHSLGRHPLAGMAAAFAGVSGGYSANLLIGTVDPLLAGITEEAAQLIDPEYTVHPAVNWYFMIVSTFLIAAAGWFVTAKIVEPRLGRYDESEASEDLEERATMEPVSARERRGLLYAGLSACVVALGVVVGGGPGRLAPVLGWAPGWGVLRNPDMTATGPAAFAPLLDSVVTIIVILFIVPGFVYGRTVGTMKDDRDVIDAMAGAMRSMGLYIVLVFFAAQFVRFFEYSGLGQILAVLGAEALVAMRLDNPLVFVPFILMCCFVNLMLGSASAQWALTAPIFVPMLMTIGYSPEVIQAAYRIGDSTTNIITPMMSYFGLILAVATKYKRDLGIGTMVATMLPYSIAFLLGWMVLFYLWVFALELPVGPGSPTLYPAPQ